jgi:hypothetical protein
MNNKYINPFFILGNPRSGTSLFRLMLNSHPNMIVPPESGFLQWWYKKYKDWNLNDSKNQSKIQSYVTDLLSSKKIEDWQLDKKELMQLISTKKPTNYAELSSLIYYKYRNNSDTNIKIVGDKNNYYIHHLGILNSIYPNAKYIHLIRDGRDVACSYKKLKQLKSNSLYKPTLVDSIEDIANEWCENIARIDSFLGNKPCLKIKYEDLIADPEAVLKEVCSFLNINYHERMLSYYDSNLNDEPKATRDWKMKTFEPIDKNNSNKYKDILNLKEIENFNKIAKTILIQNLYES